VFFDGVGPCQEVEVVRTYRPIRKARALMCQAFTHFEIEQVVSWQSHVSYKDVSVCL